MPRQQAGGSDRKELLEIHRILVGKRIQVAKTKMRKNKKNKKITVSSCKTFQKKNGFKLVVGDILKNKHGMTYTSKKNGPWNSKI